MINKLGEFIGNDRMKVKLDLLMSSNPIPHMAFIGPSGVGKSTMARLVANKAGRRFVYISSTSIGNPLIFRKVLTDKDSVTDGAIVLLDECHRLKPTIQDSLLSVLEHPSVLITVDKGGIIEDRLPPSMTFILATTHSGLIRDALMTRLEPLHFVNYSLVEKINIAQNCLGREGYAATQGALNEIGLRSREGRSVNRACANMIRALKRGKKRRLDVKTANEIFAILDIDLNGLGPNDRKYLAALNSMGQSGLDTICARAQLTAREAREKIEPWLLSHGLILILATGRVITPAGIAAIRGERVISDDDIWMSV